MIRVIFFLATLLSFISAETIRPIIQFGLNSGGDELVTIEHDYSDNYTIDAGDGINMEVGMAIENPINNFETQLISWV